MQHPLLAFFIFIHPLYHGSYRLISTSYEDIQLYIYTTVSSSLRFRVPRIKQPLLGSLIAGLCPFLKHSSLSAVSNSRYHLRIPTGVIHRRNLTYGNSYFPSDSLPRYINNLIQIQHTLLSNTETLVLDLLLQDIYLQASAVVDQ